MHREDSNGNMAQPYSLQASQNNSFRVITPFVKSELNKDLQIEEEEQLETLDVMSTEAVEIISPHVLDTLA